MTGGCKAVIQDVPATPRGLLLMGGPTGMAAIETGVAAGAGVGAKAGGKAIRQAALLLAGASAGAEAGAGAGAGAVGHAAVELGGVAAGHL